MLEPKASDSPHKEELMNQKYKSPAAPSCSFSDVSQAKKILTFLGVPVYLYSVAFLFLELSTKYIQTPQLGRVTFYQVKFQRRWGRL